MARLDLTQEYVERYKSLSTEFLNKGAIFDTQLEKMKDTFDDWGMTAEQLAEATTQMFIQVTLQYNKDAITAVNSLMRQEADEPTKDAQVELTLRQKQGYDDNLLVKSAEYVSGLTSFAVNSGSSTAEKAIEELNSRIKLMDNRVIPLDEENNCPLPIPITPIPANLGVQAQTDTTITVSWSTVLNATSYELFLDGISITTTGQSIQIIDSLSPDTKYSFNVKATVDGIESSLSPTVVGATNASP
ncbi:MAG: fibronectin type III domain-containing protein [Proteobacteria bacterium]|nr:fibronectin type III domain-containing protein [Pseudomonadota bacterium]MCH9735798.1 fibronectin type III domain-containing protein [Actinomycetes bacterium]